VPPDSEETLSAASWVSDGDQHYGCASPEPHALGLSLVAIPATSSKQISTAVGTKLNASVMQTPLSSVTMPLHQTRSISTAPVATLVKIADCFTFGAEKFYCH
jgi:hypothetical protein